MNVHCHKDKVLGIGVGILKAKSLALVFGVV